MCHVPSHTLTTERSRDCCFTEERKSDSVIEDWNRDLLSGGAEGSEWRAWSRELRETLVSRLSRGKQSDSDCSPLGIGIKTWATSVDTRVEHGGSTACQQTMSTPEEQMTMTIQQLYVRPQQFQEKLATILQAARNELVEQVQNATSTTTHAEPMIRADRLPKLRSYLGAVDQQNELEPATTEELSTPRLNRALSTQMYHILVMMKTLYRCRNAKVNEEFAERRQFAKRMGAKVCWTPEERVVLQTQRRHTATATSG